MKLKLARKLDELPRIVEARRAFFAERRLPSSLAYTVDLATEELFVNILRHNRHTKAPIILGLEAVSGGIEVSLTDHDSPPFDPGTVPPVDCKAPLSEREPGGLGLHLVHTLVGAVDYQHVDRVNTLRFRVSAEPAHV